MIFFELLDFTSWSFFADMAQLKLFHRMLLFAELGIESLDYHLMTLLQILLSFWGVSKLEHQKLYLLHEHGLLLGKLCLFVSVRSFKSFDLINASQLVGAFANLVIVKGQVCVSLYGSCLARSHRVLARASLSQRVHASQRILVIYYLSMRMCHCQGAQRGLIMMMMIEESWWSIHNSFLSEWHVWRRMIRLRTCPRRHPSWKLGRISVIQNRLLRRP